MITMKAANTTRTISVQQSGEIVVVAISEGDPTEADGMKVIALTRADWDELVGSVA